MRYCWPKGFIYTSGSDISRHQQNLSEEDKKILDDAHKNRDNPDHPAHKDHPEVGIPTQMTIIADLSQHGKFLKSVPKRLGGAAIFGAGASAGSAAFHSVAG